MGKHSIKTALTPALLIIMVLLAGGCRTQKQASPPQVVVVETIRQETDTIREKTKEVDVSQEKTKEQTSVTTTEKITIIVSTQGDTIRTDRQVTTNREYLLLQENKRLQERIDSLQQVKNKIEKIEIPVKVETPVYVEKELSLWQQIRLKGFWVLLAALGAIGIYRYRKTIIRFMMRYL